MFLKTTKTMIFLSLSSNAFVSNVQKEFREFRGKVRVAEKKFMTNWQMRYEYP